MKKMLLCLCGMLVCSFPVWAEDPAVTPEMKAQIEKPILMTKTADVKKHVTFNHATHKDQNCAFCHHKATQDQKTYVSCAVEGCHNILDKKDKSEHSYYQALHQKTVEKSCVGCHQKLAKENPALKATFTGCKPCHAKAAS